MAKKKKLSKLAKKKNDPNNTYWDRKAEPIWRELVIAKWQNKCAICGSTEQGLNCHHLIDRDYLPTKWDVMNSCLLCPNHHEFSYQISAHKNGVAFSEYLRVNHPESYNWVIANSGRTSELSRKQVYEYLLQIKGGESEKQNN